MSLFQKSVEKKYLNELDSVLIDSKYTDFQNYFGNHERQVNIKNSKEEQFQEGFLRELFVNILGYTLNPEPNFNLTTELKNIANSKKADGAILKGEDAIAVIELKSTNTTDLDSVETQAFGYKNHHPKCVYVITSNFEKLRFYIQNAVDHIDFDLFNLTREQFSLMWLCLYKDNLINNLPLKIKESSLLQEENITKKLYADYSKFREAIYNNLVKNNPETDKLLLFKKTQKLLDRFLFIFFAEDRLLLPPNSISEIVKQWTTLKDELDEYVPLYDRFKKYFGYMNTGYKGKKYDIFAYNGGLFAPDEILDNISIDDEILHKHTLTLSQYDFETDVDVNILGHIFEHSLGEIENVQAEIAFTRGHAPLTNNAPLTNTSKRKKDGIFYTPKYITKYIIENTVGKLCEEKRIELDIIDEEYAKGRKNRKKDTIKILDDKLTDYRNWLLSLTILDPACGSGAFLNQALDFLIEEHKKIDDLRAQLFGGAIIFSDITTDILEKNIYGVDLNEESVEIAKLSLWLRTAQKGRKLNKLNNNIKCGNSLIDDPEIAGEKAFNWQNEFPNIFQVKEKKAWHVTTATHNSRYSQRMFDNHVVIGEAEWFDTEDEIIITQTIRDIAIADKLNVIEYNICGDHMHILLVCEKEELPKIVGKLKSVSAKERNRKRGYTIGTAVAGVATEAAETAAETTTASIASIATRGHAPLSDTGKDARPDTRGATQRQVWTQKFGKSEIKDEEYLANAIEYIRNNRKKHELPEVKEIEKLKKEFVCSPEHAFRKEYNGGFDVVIGNPPYVGEKGHADIFESLKKVPKWLEFYRRRSNTYYFFIKHGIELLKNNGIQSLIIPREFVSADWANKVRASILNESTIISIVDFNDLKVFEDAGTTSLILTQQKNKSSIPYNFVLKPLRDSQFVVSQLFDTNFSESYSTSEFDIVNFKSWNLYQNAVDFNETICPLSKYFDISQGLVTGADKVTNKHIENKLIDANYLGRGIFILQNDIDILKQNSTIQLNIAGNWVTLNSKEAGYIKPFIKTENLNKWFVSNSEYSVIYIGSNELEGQIKNYLVQFEGVLLNRSTTIPEGERITLEDFENFTIEDIKSKYSSAGAVQKIMRRKLWWLPLYERADVPFDNAKIIVNTKNMDKFTFSSSSHYSSGGGSGGQNFIYLKNDQIPNIEKFTNKVDFTKFINAVLNSSFIQKHISDGQYNQLSTEKIGDLPIIEINASDNEKVVLYKTVIGKIDNIISTYQSISELQKKVSGFIKGKFNVNITNWYDLEFLDLMNLLNKSNIKLSLAEQSEWLQYFNEQKEEVQNIKSTIEIIDKEINLMVCEMYGLSEEEIRVLEGTV